VPAMPPGNMKRRTTRMVPRRSGRYSRVGHDLLVPSKVHDRLSAKFIFHAAAASHVDSTQTVVATRSAQ
jgi:hypothetical protein